MWLEAFVFCWLVGALSLFLKGLDIVEDKYWAVIVFGIAFLLALAYWGENLQAVITTGLLAGVTVNVLELFVK